MQASMGMMIGAAVIALLAACALLIALMRRLGQDQGQLLDPFVIEDDWFTVNTLANRPAYRLMDIDSVRFCLIHRRGGYLGTFQVVQKDGPKSRNFLFDGSAYTRRMQLSSSRDDVRRAIEKMQAELRAHGIANTAEILA